MKKRAAFSLVELLVVISIIAILAGLTSVIVSKVRAQGNTVREIAAARNLVAGYVLHAAENDGELMPGYASKPGEVMDDRGEPLHYPASGRYPWRVAKYLKAPVNGTLIINEQAKLTEKNTDHDYFVYIVSLLPSFGINATFVGGNENGVLNPLTATSRFGPFCVTSLAQATRPASLIVFCSSRYQNEGEGAFGYHMVEPPKTTIHKWGGEYDESMPPVKFGYVHPRHNGKAVTAMLDGHVELLDTEQLQDMRRWSNQAAELDEPDFVLQRL